ncbi:MFS transporter [Lacisediminihabitans sp. G11-30]|uniref:MFS transporter n=2 Tax=Lacisediminihabitans changchengi TaxID=2787634 RepID=A0A934SL76_9MICO|nr:MFS transporter [Lacisediminihabitans changchengi]MBK4347915.1 MFS transporter [Lacisediminihabitans changchengi]
MMSLKGSPSTSVSAWAPMAITAFRVLWFAQLGSNIGSWMQTVGAQWYLVEGAASATIIALVQTASLAPAIVFSLPAGVLADSLDRRKLLIWGSAISGVIAAALTVVAALNDLTVWAILAFTFVLGITSTLTSPAWQAIQPELVPRSLIGASSALGGITVNGARAVGPALAGVILSVFGAPVVFGINALSFAAAALALLWWKRPPQPGLDDREPFGAALRAGVRYVASARLVRRILARSALFAMPASALWALLPVTATRLELDSSGYGLLLGALGAGAVLGIFALPAARKRFSDNVVIAASAALFAVGTIAAAVLPFLPALVLLVLAGLAWIGTLTVLNASLQLTLPQWVRSRGASVYILVFMGTMALGSFVWGLIAEWLGTTVALTTSAALLVLVAASVRVAPLLPGTGTIDRTISSTLPTPSLVFEPAPTDGPVVVQVSYTVRPDAVDDFRSAMRLVEGSRRRTGGSRWRLYRSGETADVFLESFVVPSWGEFRRQQSERLTGRDREMRDAAVAFSTTAPTEQHFFPASDLRSHHERT